MLTNRDSDTRRMAETRSGSVRSTGSAGRQASPERGFALQARMLNATDPLRDDVKPFEVPTLNRYWSDPAFAAEVDAERDAKRALGKAAWDAAVRRNHPHIGDPEPDLDAPLLNQIPGGML